MEPIAFDESLRTGIEEIDAQHHQLIEIYNELVEALKAGRANRAMDTILARLYRYTKEHFATEERLLEATNYPRLESHGRAHAQLLLSLRKFIARRRRNDERISKEMVDFGVFSDADYPIDFVGRWVTHHIASEDLAYVEHVMTAERTVATEN